VLNAFGNIVKEEWLRTRELRQNVEINDEEFCVMPNHFHGIIWLFNDVNESVITETETPNGRDTARRVPTRFGQPVANSLSTIVGAFKSSVSKRINQIRKTPGMTIWQRNYYDPLSQKTLGGAKTTTHHPLGKGL